MSSLSWLVTAAVAAEAPVTAVTQTAQQSTKGQEGGPQRMFLLMGLMVFLMWFIVFRPQKKERQQRQQLLDALKKGDRVITVGGIHGKVSELDATHGVVSVEIAPKITIKVNRAAIASVDAKDSGKPQPEEEAEKK